MDKKAQINFWYILLAVFGVVLLRDLWVQSQTITAIPYSQFEAYLDDGVVGEVIIGSDTIRGTFSEPQDGKTGFVTTTVPPDMAARFEGTDVTYTGAVESTWLTTLLSWVLPALVFVGIWIFFIRKFAEKQGMGGFSQTTVSEMAISGRLWRAWRADAQGRAAGWSAWHRQDVVGEGRGRRGGCAVLLDLWLRVCRDVRGRRCRTCA